MDEGYATATEILLQYRHKLDFVAEFLLKHEVMEGDQFAAAMDTDATMEELEQMAEEKKRRSADENAAKEKSDEQASAAELPTEPDDTANEFQMPVAGTDFPTASADRNDDSDKPQE